MTPGQAVGNLVDELNIESKKYAMPIKVVHYYVEYETTEDDKVHAISRGFRTEPQPPVNNDNNGDAVEPVSSEVPKEKTKTDAVNSAWE